MIDTVSLTQPMMPRLSDRQLMNIGAVHPRGQTKWVINALKGEVFPSITFTTQPDGVQYMNARQSLPRMRHRHNVILQTSQSDIYDELELLAEAIYKRTKIRFNALEANVNSVDFTRDIRVGSNLITPTLKRLETRQLPRYALVRYDNGVKFEMRSRTISIYSKYHEIYKQVKKGTIPQEYHVNALQAADGVLRIESRHTLESVRRLMNKGLYKTRRAKDVLTQELSEHVISEFLEKIQFDGARDNSISNTPLDRLIAIHGPRVAMRLYGFLTMIEFYGKDFWKIDHLHFPRSTYYNNLRECCSAGVWRV